MKRKNKPGVVSVDFTGVTAEGGKLLEEGPAKLELVEAEVKTGEDSGKDYIEGKFKVVEGEENEGTIAYDNFSLQPQSLWKLRGFMEAGGHATEDGPMDIDLDALVGTVVIGNIIHEEYRRKTKHRIDGYSPVEDDAPAASSSKKASSAASSKKKPAAQENDEPDFKVRQKVTFKDGKEELEGTIVEIDGEKITVRVKGVSKKADGDYEMGADDLTAA